MHYAQSCAYVKNINKLKIIKNFDVGFCACTHMARGHISMKKLSMVLIKNVHLCDLKETDAFQVSKKSGIGS